VYDILRTVANTAADKIMIEVILAPRSFVLKRRELESRKTRSRHFKSSRLLDYRARFSPHE